MAKEKLTVRGDMASALREYAKLLDANADLKRQLRDVRREAKQAKRGFGGMSDGMRQVKRIGLEVLGVLGLAGGIGGAISKIVEGVRQWAQHLDAINQKMDVAAGGMVPFLMQGMGERPAVVADYMRQALAAGVRYGQRDAAEVLNTTQAFWASQGSFKQGLAAAQEAFKLSGWLEVPGEEARTAVGTGMGLGLTPSEAARAVVAAGFASELTPAAMAQFAGRGLPAYSGIKGGAVFGYGVGAALSRVIKSPEMAGTYAAQLAKFLQQSSGQVGEFWRAQGFQTPGSDPIGQLRRLKELGIDTMGELVTMTGAAEKKSMGAVIVLGGKPPGVELTEEAAKMDPDALFKQTLRIIEQTRELAARENLLEEARQAVWSASPEMAIRFRQRQVAAATEAEFITGTEATEAMTRDLRQRKKGLRAVQEGYGAGFVDPTTGKLTTMGGFRYNWLTAPGADELALWAGGRGEILGAPVGRAGWPAKVAEIGYRNLYATLKTAQDWLAPQDIEVEVTIRDKRSGADIGTPPGGEF